jgi:glyoxylase-like metal-dependent hydrolase (beta-lactamase superfamily II)
MEIKQLIVGELATNCYLLFSKGELAIIDPGGGVDKILSEIEKFEAKPKYIINTHNHLDHILANKEIKKEAGAEILTGLKEGDEIKIGDSILKVLDTPGHTKEGICLLGENFILTGDTLFKDGHGRTDLPGGSQKEMEKSLDKLSKFLRPGIIVYPGHGESFKI